MPTTPNLSLTYPTPLDSSTAYTWGDTLVTLFLGFDAQFATRTINQDFANFLTSNPKIKAYGEAVNAVTASATTSINLNDGNVVTLSHGTNITTLNFTNPKASGTATSFTLIRTKDNSATTRTIAWPASVDWASGVAPTLTQSANAVDTFSFLTTDGGTRWYGFVGGLNFA